MHLAHAVEAPLSHRFCDLPFSHAEIHRGGDVYFCCPNWIGFRSIGNIFKDTPKEVWNSIEAQDIRSGILEGSFCKCEQQICPQILSNKLPLRTGRDETRTILPYGPKAVKLCHDETCNLSCPSCRTRMIVAGKEQQAKLDRMLHEFIIPFLADARLLILSGDGDPFASRHYRDILRTTALKNPKLRIGLHTNAVLCDEHAWDDCALWNRVEDVLVSIDAATSATYTVIRRGADFDRLLENLRFLSAQRAKGQIKKLTLAFVVQRLNFAEMPAFVRLAKELNVDRVNFSTIQHWSRAMTEAQFRDVQVWREDHSLHPEFSRILRDPTLLDPIVDIGNVHPNDRSRTRELETILQTRTEERDRLAEERDRLAEERDRLAEERDRLGEERSSLLIRAHALAEERDRLHRESAALSAEAIALKCEVAALHKSTSWRLTQPLRWLRRCLSAAAARL